MVCAVVDCSAVVIGRAFCMASGLEAPQQQRKETPCLWKQPCGHSLLNGYVDISPACTSVNNFACAKTRKQYAWQPQRDWATVGVGGA